MCEIFHKDLEVLINAMDDIDPITDQEAAYNVRDVYGSPLQFGDRFLILHDASVKGLYAAIADINFINAFNVFDRDTRMDNMCGTEGNSEFMFILSDVNTQRASVDFYIEYVNMSHAAVRRKA